MITAEMAVWSDGAPKADSPAQARVQWAPFLDAWASCISGDFLGTLTNRVGRERLGWIDNKAFWTSFWTARGNDTKVQRQTLHEQRMHMTPYIEGAGTAGSMAFFTTMPVDALPLVQTLLRKTTVLMDPAVVAWFRTNSFNGEQEVEQRQRVLWVNMWWAPYELDPSPLALPYAKADGDAMVALVCSGFKAGLGDSAHLTILGHLMTNLPKDFDRNRAISSIQAALGSTLDVNLPLVAVCSGYAVDPSPVAQKLAYMGEALLMQPHTLTAELRELGGDVLAMVELFAPWVDSAEDLYRAALHLGLYPAGPVQTIDVDGQLFLNPEQN